MSRSNHIVSIQIDTKNLEFVVLHQFNNVKLSFFASYMKLSFAQFTFQSAVRLFDTLECSSKSG